ncbi:MAG: hypothetical protein IJG13_20955, partial [Kiritimatiellae bacterium]|nr:hypothetical protein [Kiritimatiellia bacterium]
MTIDAIPSEMSFASKIADNMLPPVVAVPEMLRTTSDAIERFQRAFDVSKPMIAAVIKTVEAAAKTTETTVAPTTTATTTTPTTHETNATSATTVTTTATATLKPLAPPMSPGPPAS